MLELETRFSSVETGLKDLSSHKMSAKENIDIIESEKTELLEKVASATIQIQELEACIEQEKQAISQLKENLENKCMEVEDLNSQINMLKDEHKVKFSV